MRSRSLASEASGAYVAKKFLNSFVGPWTICVPCLPQTGHLKLWCVPRVVRDSIAETKAANDADTNTSRIRVAIPKLNAARSNCSRFRAETASYEQIG